MNEPISEPHFVLEISPPPLIKQKWFCIQNLHMDLRVQEKKKLENPASFFRYTL